MHSALNLSIKMRRNSPRMKERIYIDATQIPDSMRDFTLGDLEKEVASAEEKNWNKCEYVNNNKKGEHMKVSVLSIHVQEESHYNKTHEHHKWTWPWWTFPHFIINCILTNRNVWIPTWKLLCYTMNLNDSMFWVIYTGHFKTVLSKLSDYFSSFYFMMKK